MSNSKYPFIEVTPGGVYIRLRVQPRSSRNALEGVHGGALKIRLTAPPVEGEANRAVVEFLSEALGVRKSALSLDAGAKSKDKRVRVEGMGLADVELVFERVLGGREKGKGKSAGAGNGKGSR